MSPTTPWSSALCLQTAAGMIHPSSTLFVMGCLPGPIKDQLAPLELPSDLDSFIAMAIRIDTRLVEREREKSRAVFSPPGQRGQSQASPFFPKQRFQTTDSPAPPTAQEEPMQLGRAKLTPEERQRRLREGRCIYCSQRGHFVARCPVKDQAHQ